MNVHEPTKWRFLSLLISLYSRIKPDEVENSVARGEILGYLSQKPGSHFNDIKKHLGFGNHKLAYHLDVLERTARIKSRKDGKLKLFYPKNFRIPVIMGNEKRILDLLDTVPGLNRKQIAKLIKVTPKTATKLLNGLLIKEKVHYEMRGHEKLYFIKKSGYTVSQVPLTSQLKIRDSLEKRS